MRTAIRRPGLRTPINRCGNFYNDPSHLNKEMLEKAVERSKKVSRILPRPAIAAHFYLFAKKSEKVAAKMAADFDKNQHGARKLTAYLATVKKKQQGRFNDVNGSMPSSSARGRAYPREPRGHNEKT